MTQARFARSGQSSPFGGLSEGRKIKLPFETETELDRRAHAVGMTYSEYARIVLMAHAHGEAYVRRMQDERLAAVLGTGLEQNRRAQR